jgi:predicted peptidase
MELPRRELLPLAADSVVRLSVLLAAALLAAPAPLPGQRVETGFVDRSVIISGKAHRYQVYVPAGYSTSNERWPVILFLHGAGERGSDGLFQTQVGIASHIRRAPASYPAIVIFPQVPADSLWIGMPADMAIIALDQTVAEFRTDPDRVYLTGMSMGGHGTWNLAYKYPTRFAAIAPICGFLTHRLVPAARAIVPPDSGDAFVALARRIGKLPTWIFHGEADPVVPVEGSRQAFAALKAAGGNVRYTELLGVDHNAWDPTYGSQQFREWLFAQRRRP